MITYEESLDSIVVHHSGRSGMDTMQAVQNHAMDEKKASDISYHFGIDDEGRVFEGRPIGVKGVHVANSNTGKIGIVFLGNYDNGISYWLNGRKLTPAKEASLNRLIRDLGIEYPRIHFLGGHIEFAAATGDERTCPGAIMEKMEGLRNQHGMQPPSSIPSGN